MYVYIDLIIINFFSAIIAKIVFPGDKSITTSCQEDKAGCAYSFTSTLLTF